MTNGSHISYRWTVDVLDDVKTRMVPRENPCWIKHGTGHRETIWSASGINPAHRRSTPHATAKLEVHLGKIFGGGY